MSCGVGRRQGLNPTLLWTWCRSAASAPSLGTSICQGCASPPNKTKTNKKKKKKKKKGTKTKKERKEKQSMNTEADNSNDLSTFDSFLCQRWREEHYEIGKLSVPLNRMIFQQRWLCFYITEICTFMSFYILSIHFGILKYIFCNTFPFVFFFFFAIFLGGSRGI